jgi:hypothetical protein
MLGYHENALSINYGSPRLYLVSAGIRWLVDESAAAAGNRTLSHTGEAE